MDIHSSEIRRIASFLALLLVVGWVNVGEAQVLGGRITDAETGEPLAGATVFSPTVEVGAVTDAQGRYRLAFDRPGAYRLVFSFIGFQSQAQTVTLDAGTETLDVALRPTTYEAPSVTVTAKAQASDILSTPQAVAVITRDEIARQRGVSAFDAAEEVAGVRLLRTGPGIAKPMIRGLSSQRVLVVNDGVRQEGQQWGDEHAPEVDAFGVDRIEVVKGPASLLYGSDALGGVVHAEGAALFDYDAPLAVGVTLQALSNPRQAATHVEAGGEGNGFAYDGGLTWKRAGSYATPDGLVPNTALEEISGAVRLGRQWQKGAVVAQYERFESDLGLFEPDDRLLLKDVQRFDIALPYQYVAHDKVKVELNQRLRGHRLEVVSAFQQNRRKEFEEHEEEAASFAKRDMEGEEPALFLRLNTFTTDARLHHRPLGRLFGTLGLSGMIQNNETLGEESLIPGGRIWNVGAYAFEEWLLDELTLTGGLRLDLRGLAADDNDDLGVTAQTRDYAAVTGAFGLAWQPIEGLSLALNTGRAWRAPVLVELFGNGVHEGTVRFERGDPALVPEQSLSLDGTVRWLGRHLYVEATGFVNYIDDYIFPRMTDQIDPASGFFVYQYDQAPSRLWGGEVKADFHPHPLDWLHLSLTGDVTYAHNLDVDEPLPFTPPARLALDLALAQERLGPLRDATLTFGPTFVATQNDVFPTETPTDGYTVFDLALSAHLRAGSIAIMPVLAVDNLFDTAYVDHLSRYKPFGILNPGRSVRLQVQFNFGH